MKLRSCWLIKALIGGSPAWASRLSGRWNEEDYDVLADCAVVGRIFIPRVDPIALLYVATVLAQRLDSANRGLLELKRQDSGRRAAQRDWANGREAFGNRF
jgi:hypothetical protein